MMWRSDGREEWSRWWWIGVDVWSGGMLVERMSGGREGVGDGGGECGSKSVGELLKLRG